MSHVHRTGERVRCVTSSPAIVSFDNERHIWFRDQRMAFSLSAFQRSIILSSLVMRRVVSCGQFLYCARTIYVSMREIDSDLESQHFSKERSYLSEPLRLLVSFLLHDFERKIFASYQKI